MNIEEFREVIQHREYVEKISCGEWAEEIEVCWKKELGILSDNVQSTIDYFKTECTANEFSWISEIFEELLEQTQSKELLDCYKKLAEKYPIESKTYHIDEVIISAQKAFGANT